jgi:hypothetical protein
MELKEQLNQVVKKLPEEQLREILDFAMFLSAKREREEWQSFGRAQFARAYGPDEPEYTEADIKPRPDDA